MDTDEPAPPPLQPPEWNGPSYGPWGYQPWMEPPPSPRTRSAGRWIVSLLLVLLIVAGTGAGVALLVSRGASLPFSTPSGGTVSGSVDQVDQSVVDVTSRLVGDQGIAAGTGMVIGASGVVLTNNHVIQGAASVTVQIDGHGPQYQASVVGDDPVNDVAVLQMQGVSNLATVTTADSSTLHVGDSVTAIGNALGQGGTPVASAGTVTGLGETITVSNDLGGTETLANLIEMNAPIQQGDSGGPLVNSDGKVVGMDTAAEVSGRRQSTSSAGYAIPINDALAIVHQIQQGGGGSSTVQTGNPPIIGVDVTDTGVSSTGVPVSGVQPGTPADQAGIVAGDTITTIDGTQVTSAATLRSAIRTHKVGDEITVGWTDGSGQAHSASLRLVAGPPA